MIAAKRWVGSVCELAIGHRAQQWTQSGSPMPNGALRYANGTLPTNFTFPPHELLISSQINLPGHHGADP